MIRRSPLVAVLPLVLVLVLALVVALAMGGWGTEGEGDRRVLEIRAGSASLIAADVAQLEEQRRRNGEGYAAGETLLADWLAQFPRRDRRRMLDWSRYHDLRTETHRGGFSVHTSSGPGASGWFSIEVDRRARRVEAACGGEPAPGCRNGRWRIARHGLQESYLLGS